MARVLLHGFLGSSSDWDEVITYLQSPSYALPLPLSFEQFLEMTEKFSSFDLVGYSMGGRFALQFALQYPQKVNQLILVSAHLGLKSEKERKERLLEDESRAQSLEIQKDLFLQNWYNLPLFESLKQKRNILEMRKNIDPTYFARLLRWLSLGKQPFLGDVLPNNTKLICGSLDLPYCKLYKPYPHTVIENAGHAIHLEEPKKLANIINSVK